MNIHQLAAGVEEELRRAERENHASLQMSGRFQVGLAAIRATDNAPLKVKGFHGGYWMVEIFDVGLLAIDAVLGKARVCVGDGWNRWLQ